MAKRIFLLFLLFFYLLFSSPVCAVENSNYYIFSFKHKKNTLQLQKKLLSGNFFNINDYTNDLTNKYLIKIGYRRFKLLKERKNAFFDFLKKEKAEELVKNDPQAFIQMLTNDPYLLRQWGLFSIRVASTSASAWDIASLIKPIKIAVVDSGINLSHPDLKDVIAKNIDFTKSPYGFEDKNGHGSHVAGIIAAIANNEIGIAGISQKTWLLNAKAIDDYGYGYYSDIAASIVWAVDNGADVVNLSLGGTTDNQVLHDAVNYAIQKGVVVVAAAGNSGKTEKFYPAAYNGVLSAGAYSENGTVPKWSNYGNWVMISAPGENILSTYKNEGYAYMSGTSMSSSFASGVAGLLVGLNVCENATCVTDIIKKTSHLFEGNKSVWGKIDAYDALIYALSLKQKTPTPTPTKIIEEPEKTPTPTAEITVVPTIAPTDIPITAFPTETPMPSGKPTLTITPTPTSTNNLLIVSSISLSYSKIFDFWYTINGIVTITDQVGNPINKATVETKFISPSGKIYSNKSQTNVKGKVSITLQYTTEKGVWELSVEKVTKSGYIYNTISKPTSQIEIR